MILTKTKEQAKQNLNKELQISSEGLALIPTEWKTEILNSFFRLNGYRISNGNLERKNSDIKTIIKVSNGYTNFERLRNRIMFSINKTEPIQAYRKQRTNKAIGKKRKPYKKKEN